MNEPLDGVVVSTRIRLARNFVGYPFPNRLKEESVAREFINLVSAELNCVEAFDTYRVRDLDEDTIAFLKERNLISQALVHNAEYSCALVSRDESLSVMINEEDHIREQCFLHGFHLRLAYERISGIDERISRAFPYAYDREWGYLTACPTNLGTGMRASVMLFLPALTRRGFMQNIIPELNRKGLTVRGSFGEGSLAEGEMYQVSNEVTLGLSEEEIISLVEREVRRLAEYELSEREGLIAEDEIAFRDRVLRAYGILTNCLILGEREFVTLMEDVRLGVATDILSGSMAELNELIFAMKPANLTRMSGEKMTEREQAMYRAEYVGETIRNMDLI